MISQLSDEWFQARIGRITGSRIGAVLGHSPWQTRNQLLKEMVAEAMGNPVREDSDAMRWGRDHEGPALQNFQSSLDAGDELVLGGWYELGSDIGFSPDAHVPGKLLVEIKCPFNFIIPPEPPAHYVDQCQLGLRVMGLDEAALHYWTPRGAETFFLIRDETWGELALPRIADFLAEYRAALLDPATWTQEERDDVQWAIAVNAYRAAKQAVDEATAFLEAARDVLLDLTDGRTSHGLGTKVEWLTRKGAVQWARLAKDYRISTTQQDAYRGESTRYARITEEGER